jgi:hypothetical protein
MTTTVEVLAAAFKEAGTPFIVGHPGGESVELMEAARQRNMRFLLMKQEVAGAMRPYRQPRHLPVDARAGRRQHGQRRGACVP